VVRSCDHQPPLGSSLCKIHPDCEYREEVFPVVQGGVPESSTSNAKPYRSFQVYSSYHVIAVLLIDSVSLSDSGTSTPHLIGSSALLLDFDESITFFFKAV
jgi:hypothetical protein